MQLFLHDYDYVKLDSPSVQRIEARDYNHVILRFYYQNCCSPPHISKPNLHNSIADTARHVLVPPTLNRLYLRLEDLACKALVEIYGNMADAVFIPPKDLCAYLNEAEEHELMVRQGRNVNDPPRLGLRKRRRDITPPEELAPKRERMFDDDKDRVLEQMEQDDSSFKANSILESDSD